MTQVLLSLGMVSMILNSAVRATASAGRVNEILKEVPVQTNGSEVSQEKQNASEIVFDHVTFSYAGASRPAIEDISFMAKQGETIGIIGPTGCGKSSLIQLVPRFYDVDKGMVLVDGLNVNDWDMDALRGRIGIAPQKPLLFSGSIAENLRWGNEKCTFFLK